MEQTNNEFQPVLDNNEKIINIAKPKLIPFLASGIPFLIIGLVWALFDLSFVTAFNSAPDKSDAVNMFLLPFIFVHMTPTWLSILNMFRLAFIFRNTSYAITNKRLILKSGFLGIDFKSIDYDKAQDLAVTVNPIENMFHVGTIKINSGNKDSRGNSVYDSMISISNPYEIFKQIKTVSVDIKTDWNYPNKLRPEENPGYQTEYVPKK